MNPFSAFKYVFISLNTFLCFLKSVFVTINVTLLHCNSVHKICIGRAKK
jgi:hypothetical protein